MSYENLNSTKILATNCACCGRPLRDAVSAEIGIGPDCREKYGYAEAVNDENRAEANRLIFLVCDATIATRMGAVEAAEGLRALGFEKLAGIIISGLCDVVMTRDGDTLKLITPYSPESVALLRSVPGRSWDGAAKVNAFPYASRNALWAVIKRAFPGQLLKTWQGMVLEIPAS